MARPGKAGIFQGWEVSRPWNVQVSWVYEVTGLSTEDRQLKSDARLAGMEVYRDGVHSI